jgi:hypothetical protein
MLPYEEAKELQAALFYFRERFVRLLWERWKEKDEERKKIRHERVLKCNAIICAIEKLITYDYPVERIRRIIRSGQMLNTGQIIAEYRESYKVAPQNISVMLRHLEMLRLVKRGTKDGKCFFSILPDQDETGLMRTGHYEDSAIGNVEEFRNRQRGPVPIMLPRVHPPKPPAAPEVIIPPTPVRKPIIETLLNYVSIAGYFADSIESMHKRWLVETNEVTLSRLGFRIGHVSRKLIRVHRCVKELEDELEKQTRS